MRSNTKRVPLVGPLERLGHGAVDELDSLVQDCRQSLHGMTLLRWVSELTTPILTSRGLPAEPCLPGWGLHSARSAHQAGGRRGSERAAERSSEQRRGARQGSPTLLLTTSRNAAVAPSTLSFQVHLASSLVRPVPPPQGESLSHLTLSPGVCADQHACEAVALQGATQQCRSSG
jgi:hypothetical protein